MNSEIVVVACKLPAGMLIEVGTPGEENYRRFEIAGPNTGHRTGHNTGLLVGGYSFTPIPKDAWVEFVSKHKTAAYLKTRAVFAEESLDMAHAAALTDSRTVTGFERLNPDKPADGLTPDEAHLKAMKAQAPKLNAGLPE